MIAWLDAHLVPEWRKALRLASVKLALIVAGASGAAVQFWPYLVQVLPYIPEGHLRTFLSVVSFLCVAFGAVGTRLWQQKPSG